MYFEIFTTQSFRTKQHSDVGDYSISGCIASQLFSNIYLDILFIWWKLTGNSYLLTMSTNDEFLHIGMSLVYMLGQPVSSQFYMQSMVFMTSFSLLVPLKTIFMQLHSFKSIYISPNNSTFSNNIIVTLMRKKN